MMQIARDVILDLIPVYLSGEASPATRALIEDYMRNNPEIARQIRIKEASLVIPAALPPDLELRSVTRTRAVLKRQRWLFGLAILFTVLSLSAQFDFEGRHLTGFHFLLQHQPVAFILCIVLGIGCWVAYFQMRTRLRIGDTTRGPQKQ